MPERLLRADSFRLDWYGFLTNQLSHIILGMVLVLVWCIAAGLVIGEFPDKEVMFFGILAAYALFEVYQDGKDIADSIEDTTFVVLWGAGLPLLACDWTEGLKFTGDLSRLMPWVFYLAMQLSLGCFFRYRLAKALDE